MRGIMLSIEDTSMTKTVIVFALIETIKEGGIQNYIANPLLSLCKLAKGDSSCRCSQCTHSLVSRDYSYTISKRTLLLIDRGRSVTGCMASQVDCELDFIPHSLPD